MSDLDDDGVDEAQPQKGGKLQLADDRKMSFGAHVACGWPFILVLFGGAIGGGLGGMAYATNCLIYKSKLDLSIKVALNIVVGVAAIVLWLVLGIAFAMWFERR